MKNQHIKKKETVFFTFKCMMVILLFTVVSCSDSSTGTSKTEPEPAAEAIPEVTTQIYDSQFVIPEDLKVTCMSGDEEPAFTNIQSCQVLEWMDYTYWALSFLDNRGSMAILAVNSDGEIAERWDRDGDRYLWKIELEEKSETATFIGQTKREIVVDWNELRLE